MFTILILLGFWQLDRADEKQQILNNIARIESQFPVHIDPKDIEHKEHYTITLKGKYLSNKQVIYDNQIVNGRAGYFVLTPFAIDDSNKIILVNRGFLLWGNTRNIENITIQDPITTITGKIQIAKIRPTLKNIALSTDFPILIQSIDFKKLNTLYDNALIPRILLLDKNATAGYQRDWKPFYGSTSKHIGYAVQWFAMALVLLIISILLLRKSFRASTYKLY